MLSLRAKIVLSLIGMSMLAVTLGGAAARTVMLTRFDQTVNERATTGFMREVAAYYEAYGSWDAAAEKETFFRFVERVFPGVARAGQERPLGPPPGDFPSAPGSTALANGPPPLGSGPGIQRSLTDFNGPAPSIIATDLEGIVRIPNPIYPPGTQIEKAFLRRAAEIHSEGEHIGYAFTSERIALSDLETQYLDSLDDSWWLALALVLFTAVPIGIFLGRRLSAPINQLSSAMLSVQPENIEQNLPVTSSDEIGQLTKNFNRMSSDLSSYVSVIQSQKEKIAEAEARRKEGMASISHELRTPLNTSVAQASAMLEGIRPLDVEQMQHLSLSLDHMTKLVDDLFQLSLADVQALECEISPTNFVAIIRESVDSRSTEFSRRDIRVSLDFSEDIEVMGDETRLRQIVDNLIENCLRYTESGGKIKISLELAKDLAELTVSDSGPGVSDVELGQLFDRFFRADPSRSRETGGSGLGLALVKVWTEIQNGSVSAFKSGEGGLGIRVTIPAA